jgi:hypothetical protein
MVATSCDDEPKTIETQADCTNVPKPILTVADVLAALRVGAKGQGDARALRRALLEALAAYGTTLRNVRQ